MKFLFNTLFFGYLSFKYRRLIRTPIILTIIILIISGIIIGLNKPFPDKKFIKELYNEFPLYKTTDNRYFSVYESKRDFSDSLNFYIENGILEKLEISYEEFYKKLWTDENLRNSINRNYNEKKGWSIDSDYYFKEYKLNLITPSERFGELVIISVIIIIGLLLIFLVSFLIEPFVIERKNKSKDNYHEKSETKKELELETVGKSEIYENSTDQNIKKESSFKNYFRYNKEYLTGINYLNRMIIGIITIPIFFIGLILMSTSVYKRTSSLGFGKSISIINSILIPVLCILTFMINYTERKYGISGDPLMVIVPLIFSITHMILVFKNGTRKKIGKFEIHE
jgi:hypothetical protein